LCGHNALWEHVDGEFDMTDEKIIALHEKRKANQKERVAVNSKAWEERKRADDLPGFLATKAEQKSDWKSRNRDKSDRYAATTRTRAKASKKHYCNDCKMSFASSTALTNHLASTPHANKVSGKIVKPSAKALLSRAYNAKMKKEKKYHCDV
jgi:Zinc-finger double-stranded RNA-binding